MNAEELKQWEELTAKFEPTNKDAVLTAIREKAHDVFQDINDGGRAAANRDNQVKIEKAEKDLKDAQDLLEKVKSDYAILEKKTPELADARKAYEEDLRKAQTQFEQKELELKGLLQKERHKNAVTQLVDRLVRDHAVDREYAEAVLAQKPALLERISVDEKTGKVTVYKEGTTDIPLVAPNDETSVIDLLAKQVAEKVDPKWKSSKVKRGSGTRGSGGDEAVETEEGSEYEAIRKERQEIEKTKSDTTSRRGGLERLGSGRR